MMGTADGFMSFPLLASRIGMIDDDGNDGDFCRWLLILPTAVAIIKSKVSTKSKKELLVCFGGINVTLNAEQNTNSTSFTLLCYDATITYLLRYLLSFLPSTFNS